MSLEGGRGAVNGHTIQLTAGFVQLRYFLRETKVRSLRRIEHCFERPEKMGRVPGALSP